jgi:hypothetical protein
VPWAKNINFIEFFMQFYFVKSLKVFETSLDKLKQIELIKYVSTTHIYLEMFDFYPKWIRIWLCLKNVYLIFLSMCFYRTNLLIRNLFCLISEDIFCWCGRKFLYLNNKEVKVWKDFIKNICSNILSKGCDYKYFFFVLKVSYNCTNS